jgi:hypothetical protein
MIYALVEPSIYMIASILPTTRHLYRRVYRKLHNDDNPSNSSPMAELERVETDDVGEQGITRHVDIRQANTTTTSSQEDLTLGEWYQKKQVWNLARPSKKGTKSTGEREARPKANKGIKGHDVSTLDSSGS